MTTDPTVLVVGGGATGTGVARDLALRGVETWCVDRDGLAAGTSTRSHGLLHSGARYAEDDRAGAAECIEESRIIREIAPGCLRETGGLFVSLAADDPEYFEEKREACEAVGIETRPMEPAAARDLAPGLSPAAERAMWVPDAVVYPSRLIAANAADTERHGGTVHPHAPLTDLIVENGRVTAAELGGGLGRVEPDYVVNAAGAWAGEVAAMAGLDVTMAPSRGVMVSVEHEGLGPVLNRCRDPDDGDIVVPHEGEVVLGTTSVPVADPDEYETAAWEVERSVEECAAMLPAVADAEHVRTWWGVRPLYEPDETGQDRRGISRGFTRLDHAADGVENAVSVADLVCDRLGVDEPCRTADRQLAAATDSTALDQLVERYDAGGPTDTDVVGSAGQ
jgi:glycerol-3-phosphate dehydrogenase